MREPGSDEPKSTEWNQSLFEDSGASPYPQELF
jgi:hypothetical protein